MDASAYTRGIIYILPEVLLLLAAALALFVHLFLKKRGYRAAGLISLAGLVIGLLALARTQASPGEIFAGSLIVDSFALYFKAVVLVAGALSILLAFRFFDVEKQEPGEAYPLILLATIGMTASVSSVDLVSLYVSFELFAVSTYILAGIFKKEKRSAEAGIKYFFLGTLSSGIMLLGMALVFGLTGQTNYGAVVRHLAGANDHIALTGMILFFAGLFFKAALVPFHMWTPDVYEGAPTPFTVFLSTAPKAAVFAILIRLMAAVFPRFEVQWSSIFQVIALASMFWGNIAALQQRNIKRLLAYSSIAHAGYLAIGLAAWSEGASTAVLFYVFIYAVMNSAAFSILLFSKKGSTFGENIDDMRGLARSAPLAAACVVVILLALTGIPPTAGFMGKYLLLAAAVEKKMYLLAAAGALNSVISLFYYFRIGRAMFMEDASESAPAEFSLRLPVKIVLAISTLILLAAGILPSVLMKPAAASSLF